MKIGGINTTKFIKYAEEYDRLELQKKMCTEEISELMKEMKGSGIDTKIFKQCLKMRDMKPEDREEQETTLIIYQRALGIDIIDDEEEEDDDDVENEVEVDEKYYEN